MASVRVRSITEGDVPALVAIQRAIAGDQGMASLERSIHNYIYYGDPDLCLVAESDRRVVGFIIGEIRPWEFGEPREVGWVKVVGVDPEEQGKGTGRILGEALLAAFRGKGVKKVRTLVGWDLGDLISYFKALGMARGDLLALEREL
jgi:predicted N-acetyltransferase YhbS